MVSPFPHTTLQGRDLLMAYSEWLDVEQGLLTADDTRSHEDLISEFIEEAMPRG